MSPAGKLYLIPNVLSEGQYETIPPAVKQAVTGLSYYLVENVRTARRYLSGLDLGLDISTLRFEVVDKNTDQAAIDRLMKPVLEGESAGVISESGCPGIADPGARLVAYAHGRGIEVVPIPGPSSIFLSLMASGLNGQRFTFHGYLPIDKRQRDKALKTLEAESRKSDLTQIFIETPYRNEQMLRAIQSACSPGTRLCVARDITGPMEWIRTARVADWKDIRVSLHKVPVVFLIYAGPGF